MSARPSIAVLLPDLRPGGAERMRINLAREWLERGFGVDFVLCNARGELLSQLPAGATVVDLAAPRVRNVLPPLTRYLRAKRPEVLLAAMWPLTVIAPLAARLAGFRGRVIVSEHNNLTVQYASRGRLHRCAMGASMRLAYPLADGVVGVSRGVVEELVRLSKRDADKFDVIYNPASTGMDRAIFAKPSELLGGGHLILSVGTLKHQKRHDLLIEAFARLPRELAATLCILGEGQQRAALERQVAELGLAGRVLLPGYVADPTPWYAHANLFVLSSDYEGFGNVIVEAMEQGVPVVSTDCPSGPREILCDGKYGMLVPVGDADALTSAMQAALESTHDHAALKARAQDFAVDKIADQYLDLLLPSWRQGTHI